MPACATSASPATTPKRHVPAWSVSPMPSGKQPASISGPAYNEIPVTSITWLTVLRLAGDCGLLQAGEKWLGLQGPGAGRCSAPAEERAPGSISPRYAELLPHLCGRGGKERFEQQGDDAQRLGQCVQRRVETPIRLGIAAPGRFRQRPGCALLYVFVGAAHELPHGV